MGSGRGRTQEEQQARQRADESFNNYKASPLEEMQNQRTMSFLKDWDSGKDVSQIAQLSPYLNLYNNAKSSQENQMVGRGAVALGQNPNTDRQLTDLDTYTQAKREQDAAGMLYNSANVAYGDAMGQSQYLINTDQNRLGNKANMAGQWYQAVMNRPKQPSFWERMLGMGVGAGAQLGAAALGR